MKNIKSFLIKKKHYLAALYLLTKQLKGVFSLQCVFQWACGLCNLSRASTITVCSLVFKDKSTRALRSQSNNSIYTLLWSELQCTTFPVHDIPTRLNNSGNLDNKSFFLDILHRLNCVNEEDLHPTLISGGEILRTDDFQVRSG